MSNKYLDLLSDIPRYIVVRETCDSDFVQDPELVLGENSNVYTTESRGFLSGYATMGTAALGEHIRKYLKANTKKYSLPWRFVQDTLVDGFPELFGRETNDLGETVDVYVDRAGNSWGLERETKIATVFDSDSSFTADMLLRLFTPISNDGFFDGFESTTTVHDAGQYADVDGFESLVSLDTVFGVPDVLDESGHKSYAKVLCSKLNEDDLMLCFLVNSICSGGSSDVDELARYIHDSGFTEQMLGISINKLEDGKVMIFTGDPDEYDNVLNEERSFERWCDNSLYTFDVFDVFGEHVSEDSGYVTASYGSMDAFIKQLRQFDYEDGKSNLDIISDDDYYGTAIERRIDPPKYPQVLVETLKAMIRHRAPCCERQLVLDAIVEWRSYAKLREILG